MQGKNMTMVDIDENLDSNKRTHFGGKTLSQGKIVSFQLLSEFFDNLTKII